MTCVFAWQPCADKLLFSKSSSLNVSVDYDVLALLYQVLLSAVMSCFSGTDACVLGLYLLCLESWLRVIENESFLDFKTMDVHAYTCVCVLCVRVCCVCTSKKYPFDCVWGKCVQWLAQLCIYTVGDRNDLIQVIAIVAACAANEVIMLPVTSKQRLLL